MGARSSPEGYRVAAGRYGLPVQMRAAGKAWHLPRVVVLVVLVLLAGCGGGGGSKSSGTSRSAACAYVAKLDQIARTVAQADVHDPDQFNKTLETAVHDYVTNVRALRAVAPGNLAAGLDRVESDVQQYRFDAALTDRSALDAYAARTCGRVVREPFPLTTLASSGSAATSTTMPVVSTTVSG